MLHNILYRCFPDLTFATGIDRRHTIVLPSERLVSCYFKTVHLLLIPVNRPSEAYLTILSLVIILVALSSGKVMILFVHSPCTYPRYYISGL